MIADGAEESGELSQLLGNWRPRDCSGSKPRCHLLTHGKDDDVATRLSAVLPPGAILDAPHWMPNGFKATEEAQLHKASGLLTDKQMEALRSWWPSRGRTPNWDLASRCMIGGTPGLLLVEAKAHVKELSHAGKVLKADHSKKSESNHKEIGIAITKASNALSMMTGQPFNLHSDSHYQLANRFAWAWKLTEIGVPVILVYLGFIMANDLLTSGPSRELITSHDHWERAVRKHGEGRIPDSVWGKDLSLNRGTLHARIEVMELRLALPIVCRRLP